jgi:energy-coupling factor transport system permease protein
MEKMNPIQRVRVYAKVAVPLILGAMVKSQQLEVVLQSKAFSGDPERTYLHESVLRKADYALIIFFTLFLIVQSFYTLMISANSAIRSNHTEIRNGIQRLF